MSLFPKDRNLADALERVELEVRAPDFRAPIEGFACRLDAFLQHHLHWRSRNSIQELVRDGFVAVARPKPERPGLLDKPQETRRPSMRLKHGALVVVTIPEELRVPPVRFDGELNILYEDDDLIAVDKPPWLPVHPSGRHLSGTLIQLLHARYYEEEFEGKRRFALRLCHRLDRETSGIVLCAKTRTVHAKVMGAFERRRVHKEYLAIVYGQPEADEGVLDQPLALARDSDVELKMAVRPDGLPSRTDWRVVERFPDHALVACRPRTGRQHQIRVHMQHLGHPLVGDKLYGPDESLFLAAIHRSLTPEEEQLLGMPRQALHNHRLTFEHPGTGAEVNIVCPLAADMRAFLDAQ